MVSEIAVTPLFQWPSCEGPINLTQSSYKAEEIVTVTATVPVEQPVKVPLGTQFAIALATVAKGSLMK